jgi:hypothetical protein
LAAKAAGGAAEATAGNTIAPATQAPAAASVMAPLNFDDLMALFPPYRSAATHCVLVQPIPTVRRPANESDTAKYEITVNKRGARSRAHAGLLTSGVAYW